MGERCAIHTCLLPRPFHDALAVRDHVPAYVAWASITAPVARLVLRTRGDVAEAQAARERAAAAGNWLDAAKIAEWCAAQEEAALHALVRQRREDEAHLQLQQRRERMRALAAQYEAHAPPPAIAPAVAPAAAAPAATTKATSDKAAMPWVGAGVVAGAAVIAIALICAAPCR